MSQPEDTPKKTTKRFSIDYLLLHIASLDHKELSEEEIEYFRAHPDQIDEISSPLTLHKLFLWFGLAFGVVLAGISKVLAYSSALEFAHPAMREFIVDIVFEMGVALLGAAIVTFMIGLSLNQQQARAKRWRKELRKRIAERP